MARGLILFACATLAWLAGTAAAQLADPTRPAVESVAPDTSSAAATPEASGLQSIIQRKGGKPAALINGAIVELGGKVGDARLVRIGDDFVVLRGPLGDETLRLTPAVEKQPVKNGKETMKGKHKK